ncbi:MAG: Trp biosynthesis-associated membrane protein [Streptosporangiaceae bacterium]
MASGALRPRSARQELALALLVGAAGAGLIFLATRQGWAHVRTMPPRPLPASLITVTGAALVPFADALALASLASLAAVVASRRLVRRLTGLLLAVLGAILAASVLSLSQAGAIAAAAASGSPTTAGAGSVTQGSASASSAIPNVAGASSHVTFVAAGWQVLTVTGAIMLMAAGALVLWRADRMAIMSARYDPPAGTGNGTRPRPPAANPERTTDPVRQAGPVPSAVSAATDSASIWDAISRGDDPTSARD